MLVLDLKVGESIKIGEAVITLEEKSGKYARLQINADKSIPVKRIQSSTMAQIAKGGIGNMAVAS